MFANAETGMQWLVMLMVVEGGAVAGVVSLGVFEMVAGDAKVSLVVQQVVQPMGSQRRS